MGLKPLNAAVIIGHNSRLMLRRDAQICITMQLQIAAAEDLDDIVAELTVLI